MSDELREALERLASWDEMAGNGDPLEFPILYRQEIEARINTARVALASSPAPASPSADWHPYPSDTMGPCLLCGKPKTDTAHSSALAAFPAPALDVEAVRAALHQGVDEPLADGVLHPNIRRSRVHAAIDDALSRPPDRR